MTEATGATTPAPTPAGGTTPWYQGVTGVDTEVSGHLVSKGWDKLTAAEAAAQAVIAHRNAEKLIGGPADKMVRLPDNANDPAAWDPIWKKLGKPADAKGYELPKKADGTPIDDAMADFYRNVAFKNNLSAAQAADLVQQLETQRAQTDATRKTDQAAKAAVEKQELEKNWGANFAAHQLVAQNAARVLGIDPNAVSALEGQVGYKAVMEMFRNIGERIGEAKFIQSGATGGVLTQTQAAEQKAALMRDKDWAARYLRGGVAENRQMLDLNKILVG